jgi:integrase
MANRDECPSSTQVRDLFRNLPSRMRSEGVLPSQKLTTPVKPDNFVNRYFRPALRRFGIENFRWHHLRHTFASRLATQGRRIQTIKELLGHRTLAMTLRYSHLPDEHLREAVEALTPAVIPSVSQ